MMAFFEELEVPVEPTDMSFSVSLPPPLSLEWGSGGLAGLFAQRRNALRPGFWRMLRDMLAFHPDVLQ